MAIKGRFKDYYSIDKFSEEQVIEFKDYFAGGGKKKLIIDMEATHAGLPLNNPRFYVPARMEEGVPSIEVGRTPMKILTHHDTNTIPVGITLDREYVHTIPEDLVGNSDVLILTNPQASMKDQLKAMRNLKRSGVTERDGYKGLGHIRIRAEISEAEAVDALEDGRLDAISTNFDSPDEIYCSICAQNIVKDGWCEHERGESYFADGLEEDGDMQFECQYIPGKHDYLEASLVVLKGDQFAVVDIVDTKNKDKNETVYLSKDSIGSGHSTFQFKDSVEEDDMKINGKEVTLSDAEQKVFDQIKKLFKEMKDEEAHALMLEVVKTTSSKKFISDKGKADIDEETAVLYAIQSLSNKDTEVKAEEICNGIREELEAMKGEKLLTKEEFEAANVKISEDGLKKLPDSAFVGPEKTFPVPDAALAIAAKRFAEKYEGPGKVAILAAISIKAKAFGTVSKDDTIPDTDNGDVKISPMSVEGIKKLKDDELKNMFHSIELELINRKQTLKRDCSECAVHVEETEAAKKELGSARDELAESDNIVSVLRNELKKAYVDYEAQVDSYVEQGAELHTTKVEKVAVISVLTNKYDSLEKAMEELKDSDIDTESKTIMDSFDITKAALKINDGMNNAPSGTVDDPTRNIDGDNKQLSEGLSSTAVEAIENIKDCLTRGETSNAHHIYVTMDKLGLFGDKLTFESLSADTKKTAEL